MNTYDTGTAAGERHAGLNTAQLKQLNASSFNDTGAVRRERNASTFTTERSPHVL
jgi:hypothetical protein